MKLCVELCLKGEVPASNDHPSKGLFDYYYKIGWGVHITRVVITITVDNDKCKSVCVSPCWCAFSLKLGILKPGKGENFTRFEQCFRDYFLPESFLFCTLCIPGIISNVFFCMF